MWNKPKNKVAHLLDDIQTSPTSDLSILNITYNDYPYHMNKQSCRKHINKVPRNQSYTQKVAQHLYTLQPDDDTGHATATFFWWIFQCELTSSPNILTATITNMPTSTVEEWLRSDRVDESPHRCRRIVKEWESEDGAFVICRADDGTQQTHKLVAMSSLSRRACYKCGNVGHYAEVCASAERLCYNCKQPGHESNGCPLPRTTEAKQCYHCQGLGHVQADCPTLRISGAGTTGRCYNCGIPGHLARACPNPNNGMQGPPRGLGAPRGGFGGGFAPRGGFAGGPRPATCYKCGGPNHFARDCQAQAMKCYACGRTGHSSRECTSPNGGVNKAGKTCYTCGTEGHIARDCPSKGLNDNLAGEGGAGIVSNMEGASIAPVAAPVA